MKTTRQIQIKDDNFSYREGKDINSKKIGL